MLPKCYLNAAKVGGPDSIPNLDTKGVCGISRLSCLNHSKRLFQGTAATETLEIGRRHSFTQNQAC